MKNGRIMLLSCEGREDVVAFWWAALRAYWPSCPMSVDVLDESTKFRWVRRLLDYLESIPDEWLLLWVDDGVLSMKAEEPLVEAGFDYFIGHPDVATLHVSGGTNPEDLEPIDGMHPYHSFLDSLHGMHRAMIPHPSFWRRAALLDVTRDVLPRLTPEQDDGWVGFYNWELLGAPVLWKNGWRGVGLPRGLTVEVLVHCNAIAQGVGWTTCAQRVARDIGYDLGGKYGPYPYGEVPIIPCVDAWHKARCPKEEQP